MTRPEADLRAELQATRARLAEAEETLHAIRNGEVDALVIRSPEGHRVYTLDGAERPYRYLVEAMKEGAAVVEPTGTVLYCNGRLAELVGQPLSQVIGGTLARFLAGPEVDACAALLQRPEGQLEVELFRPDGRRVPALLSASAAPPSVEAPAVYLVVTDLTEQRRRAEIVHASQRLAAANEALREADRRKDEFLAMLAHELRNPLAPITSALDRLVGKTSGADGKAPPREELGPLLAVLQRQTQHMARLVDELLEVSRITRGKIRIESRPLEVSSIVTHALEQSEPRIDARHQRLEVSLPEEPVWVAGDPVRLAQALSNLLNNASKYTPDRGRIWLAIAVDADPDEAPGREARRVTFSVRDDGVGIPAELLPRLFQPFSQADTSLDRSQGGLGLGLALVRGLIDLHGGSVEARSAGLGRGSEFLLRLPVLAAPPQGAAALRTSASGRLLPPAVVAPRRIVIVEDNVDAAEVLADLLRDEGHDVRVCHTGDAAFPCVREHRPQLVLLDIGLPGVSGFDVGKGLREEHGPGMRIAAISGYAQSDHRRRALEGGFDEYFVKPVGIDALRACIERAPAKG